MSNSAASAAASAEAATLLVEVSEGIARIRFNRPKVLNALDEATILAFKAAVDRVVADDSVRAVVLSGEGRAFLAGGDVGRFHAAGETAPQVVATLINPFHEALEALAGFRAPVIASLKGAVAGGGLSVALAADIAIAADDTRLSLAYSRIGTSPDGGSTFSLPRMVGLRRALGLALLSEVIEADEALRLGLVNKVVPLADLEAETERLARDLASGPTQAFGAVKRLLRQSFSTSFTDQLGAERDAFVGCAGTRDFAEGAAAFVGKRAPKFEGR